VAVLCLLLLLVAGSWNHDLWAYDEPREAELARAMWQSHNYAYTVLHEQAFLEKPPLFSATVALVFSALGEANVVAARLVAAAFALGTLVVTAWFARRELGGQAGLVAALVLATENRFFVAAHTLLLDNALVFFTTAGIVAGFHATRTRRPGVAFLTGLAAAAAFLTKGVVGPSIMALVLGLDLAWRRDARGALALLHPFALLAFFVPALGYAALLDHAGGDRGREYLVELFWHNQVGRFTGDLQQKSSDWNLYLRTWPEMLVPWTPLVLLALFLPREKDRATGVFLRVWAIAPLVALSFSQARSRFYALPVTPAYALILVGWWRSLAEREAPPPGTLVHESRVVERWVTLTLTVVAALAATAVVAFVSWLAWQEPGALCGLAVAGAVLAVLAAAGLVFTLRSQPTSEATALLVCLLVVAAALVYSGKFFALRGDARQSYRPLADEVWAQAKDRRLLLFHYNDSWSGTFPFYAGRSTPGFNELGDPHGERLLEALGPATRDVVLAPTGALSWVDPVKRQDLVIEWQGERPYDRDKRSFVLFRRRLASEPACDPIAGVGSATHPRERP
jgi:4-amino-4-deoxy-L-arabinose transferase-like glycosyltransferase